MYKNGSKLGTEQPTSYESNFFASNSIKLSSYTALSNLLFLQLTPNSASQFNENSIK
jgi:hypothetical protein